MSLIDRLRSLFFGDRGPVGTSRSTDPSESDAGSDPRAVGGRVGGGAYETFSSDRGSVTGTGDTDQYVGQIAGDDLGYAEETGAERRRGGGDTTGTTDSAHTTDPSQERTTSDER